jgi:hypothetical protein
MLHIPVCLSDIETIEEIAPPKKGQLHEQSLWRKKFPFSCGNWRSNETKSFIKEVNVNLLEEPEMVPKTLARVSIPNDL